MVVVADVTRREEIDRAVAQVLARFGRIDVWINNAGRGITRNVSELTDADFDEMMLVNVKSVLYGMQAVLPHFRERGSGHIINVSSMLGRIPFAPFRSAYIAAKHAMNGLTACLRMELRTTPPGDHRLGGSPRRGRHRVRRARASRRRRFAADSRRAVGRRGRPTSSSASSKIRAPTSIPSRTARQMVVGYYGAEDMAAFEAQSPSRRAVRSLDAWSADSRRPPRARRRD